MDVDGFRGRLDETRWRWMPPAVIGLAAATSLARFAGEWILFAVAAFWVVPLVLGYEIVRPVLRNGFTDRVAGYAAWVLTLAPWTAVLVVFTTAALVPSFDGVAIGLDSGQAWALLPWFFAAFPAAVVPWVAWHVLAARGRPRERWAVVVYPTLFLAVLAVMAYLNAHWAGQTAAWGPLLATGAILGTVATLLHGLIRTLWPRQHAKHHAVEPPAFPDLVPRD